MRSNDEHAPTRTAHGRFDAASDVDRIAIQVWGTRYIDDAAIRGESTDLTNDDFGLTLEKTRYYATDALFSTVALLDSDGDLLERVRYTPYGEARHWKAADLDGDGDVDDDDKDILWDAWGNSSDIADAAYNADADINRDGTVDGTDDGIRLFSIGPALPAGQISEHDNPIGYAGYVLNAADATYSTRGLAYDVDLGRFLRRLPQPRTGRGSTGRYYTTARNPLADLVNPIVSLQPAVETVGQCADRLSGGFPGNAHPQCRELGNRFMLACCTLSAPARGDCAAGVESIVRTCSDLPDPDEIKIPPDCGVALLKSGLECDEDNQGGFLCGDVCRNVCTRDGERDRCEKFCNQHNPIGPAVDPVLLVGGNCGKILRRLLKELADQLTGGPFKPCDQLTPCDAPDRFAPRP